MASGTGANPRSTKMTSELYTSEHLHQTTNNPYAGTIVSIAMVLASVLALAAF